MKARDIDAAINSVIKAKRKIDEMNSKYPIRYVEELKQVGESVISRWYASYEPIYYKRTGSLYDAYHVTLNGTDYSVEFDDSLLKDETIFVNSFIYGYHGGAYKGEGHPNPGIPYWKTPFPKFKYWGRPAKLTMSPYQSMVTQMKKKIKEIDREKQREFDNIMNKVQKAIDRLQ